MLISFLDDAIDTSIVVSEKDFDISFIKVAKRVNCIAHQLELIVGSIFDDKVRSNVTIMKVLSIISAVRKKKTIVRYLREHCGKSLLTLSATRWGSASANIDRFLLVHEQLFQVRVGVIVTINFDLLSMVFQIAVQENVITAKMSEYEIAVVRNVASLLLPFRTTLMELQASKTVTVSKVYGFILNLMTKMSEAKVNSFSSVAFHILHYFL